MPFRAALVFLAALGAVVGGAVLVPPAQAAGPELLPNPSFEDGYNRTAIVSPVGTFDQPLLPVGWAFEGAAGLFDHSAEKHVGAGRYSAAISIPASNKRRECQRPEPSLPETCADNVALNTAKDTGDPAYSVTPAWRPLDAVPAAAGVVYRVAGWYTWQLATKGVGGALVKVRWLDANGVGIRTDTVLTHPSPTDQTFNWTPFERFVQAPGGAVQAVPLFGALDDTSITKLAYDEVSFRAA